ncbi:PREDICTED: glutathione S-transferase A-like [Branchiostoma belcheri]|uniref:Glutathione S-transferase A-like n=1 Tax=Branchiostoma belcheri TaxID=7741 RepID=A0A6P4Z729_BRABE|nr:PREDICTED: glutathione S-transferase A-like [Branchiostoma belcheri]
MSSSEEFALYYESGSTPCMSMMLALEEKGISYTKTEVDTDKEKDAAMLEEVGDRDEPPLLLHGENVLFDEVVPACLYLEKISDKNRLIPEGAVGRAHVIQRMLQAQKLGIGDTSIDEQWDMDEEANEDELEAIEDPDEFDEQEEKYDKMDLVKEIEIWEGYLKEYGKGSYIAGPEFTAADCLFIPVLIYLVTNQLDLTKKYPMLQEYYTRVMERPAVKEVQQYHQMDAEGIFKNMPEEGVLDTLGSKVKGLFGKLVKKKKSK